MITMNNEGIKCLIKIFVKHKARWGGCGNAHMLGLDARWPGNESY